MNDFKREMQKAKKLHLSWRARLLIFIIGAPAIFLFALYGRLELAWPLMISIGMMSIVIWLKWALRRRVWFWIAMAAIGIFHIALIIFVPWPATWVPALLMTIISTVDSFLILWVIVVIERAMGQSRDYNSTSKSS